MSFDDLLGDLQPASFRGVPFGVVGAESRFGRGVVMHEYPYRDEQWPEDLGRATRKFSIQGFLITDSLIYGGGDVQGQREKLIAAVETKGSATLIHPTLGRLQVSIPDDGLVITDRLDAGSYAEFTLLCLEAGDRVFPSASSDSADASDDAAQALDDGAESDWFDDAIDAVQYGQSVFDMAVATATDWVFILNDMATDAAGVFNMAARLPGNFGRYFGGALTGFAAGLIPSAITLTLEDLVLSGTQARVDCIDAGIALVLAASADDPDGVPAAARNCVEKLIAATQNPADGVRLLIQLADFYPNRPGGVSVVGVATDTIQDALGALLRRSALAGLVRVSATYNPFSEDDADSVRTTVCDALDAEALIAGDAGDDASYKALSNARGAVAADLDARGAKVPPMRQFTFATNLPSLVIANQLYQDAARAEQLVDEANARHPAFMPTTFRALSS